MLSGQTLYQKGVLQGSLGGGTCGAHAMTSGLAFSDSPTAGWKVSAASPLFLPEEICNTGIAPEGPSYFFDKGSGSHLVFVNRISGGARSIEAFWTRNRFGKWPMANRKTIITWDQIPWSSGRGQINLPTVLESADGRTLSMYFGARIALANTTSWNSYLFHDIGLLTMSLPLLSKPQKSSELVWFNPLGSNTMEFGVRYADLAGEQTIGYGQLIVSRNADWTVQPYLFRGMYIKTPVAGLSFAPGVYLWAPDQTSVNYGWGAPASVGTSLSNRYVTAKVSRVTTVDATTVEVVWQVTFNQAFGTGPFNAYLFMTDRNDAQDTLTTPNQVVVFQGKSYYFPKGGVVRVPPTNN
jgi:hypothetical protein